MSAINTILITGASRGIGLELVKQLLTSNPERVVYATIRTESEELLALQKQFSAKHLNIEPLEVTNDESIKKLVEKLKKDNAKLDLLVNNAAVAIKDDPITN